MNQGQCPECGADTFITRKIDLSWLGVFGASILSALLLLVLWVMIVGANRHGRFTGLLIMVVIFTIGFIFANFVKKDFYRVERCNKCDFNLTAKLESKENGEIR